MITSTVSPSQTSGAHCPPCEASTDKKPIENGIDSHHIEFELRNVVDKVQTVVGASLGENRKVDDALASLKPRLLEAYKKGSCLVSFGSSHSFDRITNMQTKPIKANSSSLIEQILAQFDQPPIDRVKLSDDVTLTSLTKTTRTDANGLKYHSGKITFQVAGKPDKKIEFREFCPNYRGKSLNSETLLAALKHVPEPKPEDSNSPNATTNKPCPQFYSAKGIGRSASLAVLYSFREMCAQQKNGFTINEVQQHFYRLIKQGREQRNQHFVNTRNQENDLLAACLQINKEIIQAKTTTAKADPASVDSSSSAVRPAAASQTPKAAAASTPKPAPTALPTLRPARAAAQANATAPVATPALTPKPTFTPKPASTSVITPASGSTPATPKPGKSVKLTFQELAKNIPTVGEFSLGKLPYMPINVDGITKLASKDEFQLPTLTAEEAGNFATDIYKAGFHGDALGADLESHFYVFPPGITDRKPPRKTVLESKLIENREYRDSSTTQKRKDEILITQLKKYNGGGHGATDDTQQGALSAVAKMAWIKDGKADLNELAMKTLATFRTPAFPNHPQNPTRTFRIRGAASTLRMCQDKTRHELEWRDVAIYDFDKKGQICRAGGAGNGGMMRIGYDLLPVLASGATTQDLVKQILISNQVTHPSSFSAVACVGQVMLMAKCINLRLEAEKNVDKKLEIPQNFFINTFYDVASELEHPGQLFRLDDNAVPVDGDPYWRTERLPSEFLKGRSILPNNPTQEQLDKAKSVNAGSVQTALEQNKNTEHLNSIETAAVLQRWNSRSYLGATFPTVVFLLEKFGYENPALAVNMAALVTKDSDTCATIIAQVMGALHGSDWVNKELASCRDDTNKPTFNDKLGGGFTLDNLIAHTHNFYNERENQKKSQRSPR